MVPGGLFIDRFGPRAALMLMGMVLPKSWTGGLEGD
jgi:hypothetical protein